MTAKDPIAQYVTSDHLIAEVAARAPRVGPNAGLWPGLTIHRYTEPTPPRWHDEHDLSLEVVAQGRKAVTDTGKRYVYGQFDYLVISSRRPLQSEVLDASPTRPCLYLILRIDPSVVSSISATVVGSLGNKRNSDQVGARPDPYVASALDYEVMSAVLRFLQSLSSEPDRRVLTPLCLTELIYRVVQRDPKAQIRHLADGQLHDNPVGAALAYIKAHLSEPLTVDILAAQVNLSASAFSRSFRNATGMPPYRYVKQMRLDRGRELALQGRLGVATIAHAVGYRSTSHFIKEFRLRFGATPGEHAESA